MSIAREGFPFILVASLLALLLVVAGWKWLGILFAILALAFAGFFRDPERVPPAGDGLILSPADGKVVGIKQVGSGELFGGAETRISIFLSPLDVHINRSPVQGEVEEVRYRQGSFFAAYKEKASRNNEQNAVRIVDAKGRRVGVVQIAGFLARRIVCYVKSGDPLRQGEKFGMIMFGSRVDIYLSGGSRVEVVEGQRVKGGETIVGRLL